MKRRRQNLADARPELAILRLLTVVLPDIPEPQAMEPADARHADWQNFIRIRL
jgi:hypothetical protein